MSSVMYLSINNNTLRVVKVPEMCGCSIGDLLTHIVENESNPGIQSVGDLCPQGQARGSMVKTEHRSLAMVCWVSRRSLQRAENKMKISV